MSQLLDLRITLLPAPENSSPDTIARFDMRCEPAGLISGENLLTDPLTNEERNDLRWYLEEYWKWPYEEFAVRGKYVESSLVDIGKRLYSAVFGSAGAKSILEAWQANAEIVHQISIVSDVPTVLSLPWELLHDEQTFLVLSAPTPISITRKVPQYNEGVTSLPLESPLRILLITARPKGTGFVDPRAIAHKLLDEMQEQLDGGSIELEFLRPPTLDALRKRLQDQKRPIHILHFDGHGTFTEGQGALIFEDKDGWLTFVKSHALAQLLQHSGVRLVVLTACQSAMNAADTAFSSVATQLIQNGVDAVVAMSASVLVASATRYAEAFYCALAAGKSPQSAHEQARRALYDNPHRHPHRRRRDEVGGLVALSDWWLPHFYQQHPVIIPSMKAKLEDSSPSLPPRFNEEMPPTPHYGFSGRARELLQIERCLMQGKLVVIHGFTGVGKTALAREAADWLTRTRMYEKACFVSFKHGGDATWLLSGLGTFLGIYDGNYTPDHQIAALAKLKLALQEQRVLIIADNLESILHGGEAQLDVVTQTKLWNIMMELAIAGAGILLTSGTATLGDGWRSPGSKISYLELKGLHPDDAYELATRMLENLGIDLGHISYTGMQDLLKQLDYHPLAIQLVLPALHEVPLAKLTTDFATLLPKFSNDEEVGHHRSLLALLDYSLQRLRKEQQALLSRLVFFVEGASEENLQTITQIAEDEWMTLRSTLEQTGLLMTEQVHEAIPDQFLRFHPILIPFLRSKYSLDNKDLRERYVRHYGIQALTLYAKDFGNSQNVRPLLQRELPNLLHTLNLLLEEGDSGKASAVAECIIYFLNVFGLERERDTIRRRITDVVTTTEARIDTVLTPMEWLGKISLGEDEFRKGRIAAALALFTDLLEHIEMLPEDLSKGRGSHLHCLTLDWLARCLWMSGHPAAAERRLHEALAMNDVLLRKEPDSLDIISGYLTLQKNLGDVLCAQGKYQEAQRTYGEVLEIAIELGHLNYQAAVLSELGFLALEQQEYVEARLRYTIALNLYHKIGEPLSKSVIWHQLGLIAQEQEDWAEAERCYRESLALKEQFGHPDRAGTCNQLGVIAVKTGRSIEAKGWWERALELEEQAHPSGPTHATILANLARLLLREIGANRAATTYLAEAKDYAERALAIEEKIDTTDMWRTLGMLGDIADLEGQREAGRDYYRRERESYAASINNRSRMDRQYGKLIAAIAYAARGDAPMRAQVEDNLPQIVPRRGSVSSAIERIYAGERDWNAIAEDLEAEMALLILRVLEVLARTSDYTVEEIYGNLSDSIEESREQEDESALERVLEALSPEERLLAIAATDPGHFIYRLVHEIAAIADGNTAYQSEVEAALTNMETEGRHLKKAIKQMWAGQSDTAILTAGLDEWETTFIIKVLKVIAENKIID